METVEELKSRIKELELELSSISSLRGAGRERIGQMSSEVVDSNPYRLVI